MNKNLFIFSLTAIVLCITFVNAAERIVLVESFTSTTCPPCVPANQYFDAWLKNYSNAHRVAVIKYHVWWPSPGNDPFYLANPNDVSVRNSYYNPGYVPRTFINGTVDGGSNYSNWPTLIENQMTSDSPFELNIYGNISSSSGGTLYISVKSDGSVIPSGTLRLYTVITESNLEYTGPNGDPVHHSVMRKIFPNSYGETFTIALNETKIFERAITWDPNWVIGNSNIIVFIQIAGTKQVLQAVKRNVVVPTQLGSISGIKFYDKNGNGIKDLNESNLSNWKIFIDGTKNDSMLTDINGVYTFTGLAQGTYQLFEEHKEGWIQTFPTSPGTYNINLGSGQPVINRNFGNKMPDTTINIPIKQGWNLVSVPTINSDNRYRTLFATAVSNAFSYNTATGYLTKDTLSNGEGYWAKFSSTQNVSLFGIIKTRDTINVKTGWNLIGSITYPILTSSIMQIPGSIIASPFYGFDVNYKTVDTLKPGHGYWVKVFQDGKLILQR